MILIGSLGATKGDVEGQLGPYFFYGGFLFWQKAGNWKGMGIVLGGGSGQLGRTRQPLHGEGGIFPGCGPQSGV